MRLLDEVVSRDEHSIVCRKTFSASEFFVQGHFPDQPIVPGVIQCECCLQAGAVLLSGSVNGGADDEPSEPLLPVATRMDNVKFKQMVRPGDTVEIQVTLKEQLSNAYFLTGKMTLDGKLTTRLDFAVTMAAGGDGT